MSRGPGKIERAIEAVFATEPDDSFTTEELCERVYRGVNRVERKHHVAVIRAAKKVCLRMEGWGWSYSESPGNSLVFFNCYRLPSYATHRMKLVAYIGDSRFRRDQRRTPEGIRTELAPGGGRHQLVVEGGAWWRHVQLNIARRDGDSSERVQKLIEEQERINRSFR